MTDWPQVPDEAVDEAASALIQYDEHGEIDWGRQARAALTAAMPHLGRAWLEWAAEEATAADKAARDRGWHGRAVEYATAAAFLRTLAASLPPTTDARERMGP